MNASYSCFTAVRLLMVFLLGSTVSTVSADCIDALVKDFTSADIQTSSYYALSDLLANDKRLSDRSRKGVSVLIDGVNVSTDSDQARRLRESFYRDTGVNWSHENKIALVSSSLSRNAVEAYKTCVDGKHNSGLRVIAFNATPTEITVKIRWISSPRAPTEAKAIYEFTGAAPRPLEEDWKTGEEKEFVFARKRKEDFRFSAEIGGETDRVFVPWAPRIELIEQRDTRRFPSGGKRMADDGTARNQGPIQECSYASHGSEILPQTASVNVTIKVGPLDGSTYAKLTHKDHDRVCYESFFRPLEKGKGGDFRFYISYREVKRTFRLLD